MKRAVPKSVGKYIAAQPEAVRPKLEQVRAAVRRRSGGSRGHRVPHSGIRAASIAAPAKTIVSTEKRRNSAAP